MQGGREGLYDYNWRGNRNAQWHSQYAGHIHRSGSTENVHKHQGLAVTKCIPREGKKGGALQQASDGRTHTGVSRTLGSRCRCGCKAVNTKFRQQLSMTASMRDAYCADLQTQVGWGGSKKQAWVQECSDVKERRDPTATLKCRQQQLKRKYRRMAQLWPCHS